MNRYQFKLQRVLDVKNIYKELRRKDLRESMLILHKQADRLKNLQDDLSSSQNDMKSRKEKKFRGFELTFYYSYFNFLSSLIDIQNKKIKKTEAEIEVRREKLLTATKEKEILEKLKERTWQEYQTEFRREEQIISDEISSANFFRREEA